MNALQNKVQLIGNLGSDPDVRNTESGKKMARVSIATNENYRNAKGETIKETQWHNAIAWGKNAELMEKYLTKGSQVAIEGKLVSRNYVDKEGVKRYVTEVQVNDILFLNGRNNGK
ncbi:MAG: single-stranded DNA-binding protein [Chitinophagaceae bacterium]|nr:single-stranded DNA-binding protein [Chitinophagaceae bacterium]